MQRMVAVVIPAFGRMELTHGVVQQLAQESDRCRPVVVDNAGDYSPIGDELVHRTGENLGWLRGTNEGVAVALREAAYTHVCMLNNDVVLAPGFVEGLLAAAHDSRAGLVAPCYDDHYAVQASYYAGPAATFQPQDHEVDADVVDGTCMLLPRADLEALGPLDAKAFGRYGWGGADDLCLRARRAGRRVVVTRRAYLQHQTGATASTVVSDYRVRAAAEMYVGMRRKYGRHWMRQFPSGSFDHHSSSLFEYARHLTVQRSGLRVGLQSSH